MIVHSSVRPLSLRTTFQTPAAAVKESVTAAVQDFKTGEGHNANSTITYSVIQDSFQTTSRSETIHKLMSIL